MLAGRVLVYVLYVLWDVDDCDLTPANCWTRGHGLGKLS